MIHFPVIYFFCNYLAGCFLQNHSDPILSRKLSGSPSGEGGPHALATVAASAVESSPFDQRESVWKGGVRGGL